MERDLEDPPLLLLPASLEEVVELVDVCRVDVSQPHAARSGLQLQLIELGVLLDLGVVADLWDHVGLGVLQQEDVRRGTFSDLCSVLIEADGLPEAREAVLPVVAVGVLALCRPPADHGVQDRRVQAEVLRHQDVADACNSDRQRLACRLAGLKLVGPRLEGLELLDDLRLVDVLEEAHLLVFEFLLE